MDELIVNPFVSRMKITNGDKVKLVLGLIFLMPIRLTVTILLVILSSSLGYTFSLVFWLLGLTNRMYYESPAKLFCLNLTTSIFGWAMFCTGFRVVIVDKRSREDRALKAGIVIIAPHSSHYDFGSMLAISPKTPVAKKKDMLNPFFGSQLILSNAILVERGDEASRQQVFKALKDRSLREMIGLFPEATVTNGTALLQFKLGGFIPGVPVSPVTIAYESRGSINSVTWTWQSHHLFVLWMLCCAKWSFTTSTVTFLPTYYPNDEEKRCPALYAENVRKSMANELKVPCSRYSYEEAFFLDLALKQKIPLSPTCLKLVKIIHKISRLAPILPPAETCKQINGHSTLNGRVKPGQELTNKSTNGSVPLHKTNGVVHKPTNGLELEAIAKETIKPNKVDVATLLKQVVTESIYKIELLDIDVLRNPIPNHCGLFDHFRFPTVIDPVKVKTALADFFECLRIEEDRPVSGINLLVILYLADISEKDVWRRVEKAFRLLVEDAKYPPREVFRLLVFYLLGVEDNQIQDTFLDGVDFSFEFLKNNLVSILRKPVYDNAPFLVEKDILQTFTD